MSNRQQLEQAIAVQEGLRGVIDDAILDATLAALRAQLDAQEPPAAPESRRALATILFIDLVGHTDLIQGRDPEEIMEIIDRALERLAEPIERYNGRIVRYQGDGYKAVFGLPTSQENDPDNAVLAGLDILAEAADIAAELETERDLPGFQVRVGIDTGLVLTGGGTEGEDAVTGLPVNLAARLESAAEPGTVLISHHTYQHVRGVFDFQPLEPVQAKGFPQPVAVYRVLRRKPRSFRTRRRGVEGVETRMIGRDAELAALQALFGRIVENRERLSAVVVGEAGLGKSRLLYEFENWVDLQPVNVQLYRGRARLETQQLPFGLLRDMFVFRCGIYDDDAPAAVRAKIVDGFHAVLGGDEAVEMKAHLVGHLLGYDFSTGPYVQPLLGDPHHLRSQALLHVGEYFKTAADNNPILLLFEDLHWADDSSLEAIASLAAALEGYSALFVGAARPVLYERRPDWMAGRSYHRRIDLSLLDDHAGALLVAEILQKTEGVPDQLGDLIVATAEGNPFYAEELVKMFIDEGVIVKGEDTWRVELERLAGIHVPPTLTGVLQARLESLPPEERAALQRASVVGRQFWDAAVEYISEQSEPNTVLSTTAAAACSALQRREIIFLHEETAFEGTNEYVFKHALLRDVTYESVLLRLRRGYHRRAAEWLIRTAGDRVDEYANLIAAHFAYAGDDALESEWQARAGKHAAARYATAEAVRAFSRALELLPASETARRYDYLLERERLLNVLAQRDAQAADLDELEALSEQHNDTAARAEVSLRRANYNLNLGDFQATLIAAKQANELALATGDVECQANAEVANGMALRYLGDFAGSRARLENALILAQTVGARKVEANALRQLGVTAEEQGDLTGEAFYFEGAYRLARELGDRWGERRALNSLGILEQNKGAYEAARRFFEQSLAIARNIGDRLGENTVLGNLGVQAYQLGQYIAAQALFEESLQIARDTNDLVGINTTLLNLAYISALNGEVERALLLYDEARGSTEAIGDRPLLGYIENGTGRTLLEDGRAAAALDFFRRALAIREELDQPHLATETRALLAEALMSTGEAVEPMGLIDQVLGFLESDVLETTEDTLRAFLAAYRVLSAAGDRRADAIMVRAYDVMQAAAASLDEPSRQAYLQNVPWNRTIAALWEERAGR